MENTNKAKKSKKHNYKKPQIDRIILDNSISMVMQSPPPDPGGSIQPEHFSINPFKL